MWTALQVAAADDFVRAHPDGWPCGWPRVAASTSPAVSASARRSPRRHPQAGDLLRVRRRPSALDAHRRAGARRAARRNGLTRPSSLSPNVFLTVSRPTIVVLDGYCGAGQIEQPIGHTLRSYAGAGRSGQPSTPAVRDDGVADAPGSPGDDTEPAKRTVPTSARPAGCSAAVYNAPGGGGGRADHRAGSRSA